MSKPTRHGSGWRIRWDDENGIRQSETIRSSCEDAEFALQRHKLQVEEIRRGLREPSTQNKKFSEVCDLYLKHVSIEKRRLRDDESLIRAHLRPFFGDLSLKNVGNRVDEFKAARRHLSSKTLHNQLTLLISILRYAHDKGWLPKLPKIKKPKLRLFDKDFRYLKTNDEITRFLVAARQVDEMAYVIYATVIYTGMREGEIAGLKRDRIDFARRLICIQNSLLSRPTTSEIKRQQSWGKLSARMERKIFGFRLEHRLVFTPRLSTEQLGLPASTLTAVNTTRTRWPTQRV